MKRLTAGSSACQQLISAQSPDRASASEMPRVPASQASASASSARAQPTKPTMRRPALDERVVAAADLPGEDAGDVAEGRAGERRLGHQVGDQLGEADTRVALPAEAQRVEVGDGAGKADVRQGVCG